MKYLATGSTLKKVSCGWCHDMAINHLGAVADWWFLSCSHKLKRDESEKLAPVLNLAGILLFWSMYSLIRVPVCAWLEMLRAILSGQLDFVKTWECSTYLLLVQYPSVDPDLCNVFFCFLSKLRFFFFCSFFQTSYLVPSCRLFWIQMIHYSVASVGLITVLSTSAL